MNSESGSQWRKWDLHVHTPASLVQQDYGGGRDEIWEKFISDLEALPEEFSVLGINDYIFIDGYKKVLEYKENGRLQNIDLLLPVIELRIDQFGGSKSKLSRVNYHIIFSNEVKPDQIQQRFLNALPNAYQIDPKHQDLSNSWSAVATKESLIELGSMIIESIPDDQNQNYDSPLEEGFNNLNFKLDSVLEKLNDHAFEDKFVTAVGKTEWADIKWNTQTIANKKSIINGANLVFTAAETLSDYNKSRKSLQYSNVNSRLLDCSDAHDFSSSSENTRIGNCNTWIKADPTFNGLQHAIHEFEERVAVFERPGKLDKVEQNRTKYIRSISINQNENYDLEETWFEDVQVDFNHNLIAIIGQKGNGKSALTDIISLLGNSTAEDFSFLNDNKFKNEDNKARCFKATLTWESGKENTRDLHEDVSESEVEKLKYVSQEFFDSVCDETKIEEDSAFDREVKQVIFSHIENSDRLGCSSLDKLISHKTEPVYESIEMQRQELSELNEEIINIEKQLTEEHRDQLINLKQEKEEELDALEDNKPEEVERTEREATEEDSGKSEELEEKENHHEKILAKIRETEEQRAKLKRQLSALDNLNDAVKNRGDQLAKFRKDQNAKLEEVGLEINLEKIISLEVDRESLKEKRVELSEKLDEIEESLDAENEGSLAFKEKKIDEDIEVLKAELEERDQAYQSYKEDLKEWQEKKKEIVGDTDTHDSLEYYKGKIREVNDELPKKLSDQKRNRLEKVAEIYGQLQKILDVYNELTQPVQQYINDHDLVREKYKLSFNVSLEESGFAKSLFSYISHGRRGSFCGKDEGEARLQSLIQKHDFSSQEDTVEFAKEVLEHLEEDRRTEENKTVSVESQIRKSASKQDIYDSIFDLEYLNPQYSLKLDGKSLSQLSPGQRGVLLLIFYLLIDKNDRPLIIDQPEANLDSQSVYELLVPGIREAKKHRQVFIVTHNPNLAVVCDAEQIVRAQIDIEDGYTVSYEAGALENPKFNDLALNILEGTKDAFSDRYSKYQGL